MCHAVTALGSLTFHIGQPSLKCGTRKTKRSTTYINSIPCANMPKKYGELTDEDMQRMLQEVERELAELYALQNPPPPVDAATQTQPLQEPIFLRSKNPADCSIQCSWIIEHSLTIEFKGNYNWSSRYGFSGILQRHIIGNAICEFAKKGSKTRDFLHQTFGNTLTVTHGLHYSSNDGANPHGLPHFNATNCNGQPLHVYCKPGMNPRLVHIVSFSKIQIQSFHSY